MQGKVEIAGVNTAKLKVLKNDETMEPVSYTHLDVYKRQIQKSACTQQRQNG